MHFTLYVARRLLFVIPQLFGIILVRSWFIFSSWSKLGINGWGVEYGAIDISWSFVRSPAPAFSLRAFARIHKLFYSAATITGSARCALRENSSMRRSTSPRK